MLSDDYVLNRTLKSKTGLDDDMIDYIQSRLKERAEFKKNKDYEAADSIRDELRDEYSVSIDDRTREWSVHVTEYTVMESSEARRPPPPPPYSIAKDEEVDFDAVEETLEMADSSLENGEEQADDYVEEAELASLTVVQLKDRLREAGLPVSGKKAELIERLTLAE